MNENNLIYQIINLRGFIRHSISEMEFEIKFPMTSQNEFWACLAEYFTHI